MVDPSTDNQSPTAVTYQPADAAGVAAVHLATRRSAYADLLPSAVLAEMSAAKLQLWWQRRLATAPQPHRMLVALSDLRHREVRGFAHVGPADDQGVGELYAIHVHPRAQRLGLGVRLLAAAVGELADLAYSRARLWVLEGNRPAQGFYRHHGCLPVSAARRQEEIEGTLVVEVAYERDLRPRQPPASA
jgi:ribosomal protein S18 acetylase RimI-like enzyme